jgi:hypothetical protein
VKIITQILLKALLKHPVNLKTEFKGWQSLKNMAIVVDTAYPINKSELDKFCKELNVYVEVFYVELNAKIPSFADWQCFTKKQKTIFNLPKQNTITTTTIFDCVINACDIQNYFATALCYQLKSNFVCGINSEYNKPQLVVLKTENSTLISYLTTVVNYLKMIKV